MFVIFAAVMCHCKPLKEVISQIEGKEENIK